METSEGEINWQNARTQRRKPVKTCINSREIDCNGVDSIGIRI